MCVKKTCSRLDYSNMGDEKAEGGAGPSLREYDCAVCMPGLKPESSAVPGGDTHREHVVAPPERTGQFERRNGRPPWHAGPELLHRERDTHRCGHQGILA